MADTPSPYAPGIIVVEERVLARAPGRAVVFLVAAVAMGIATNGGLWPFWLDGAASELDTGPDVYRSVLLAGNVVALLGLPWAYLTDVLPLFGTRREGYLLVAGVVTATAWGALAVAGGHVFIWYGVSVLFSVAMVVARGATLGALAEIGQRRRATGTLAATWFGVAQLGSLGGMGLLLTPLDGMAPGWTAGLGAGVALSIVLVVVTLADERAAPPAQAAPAERVSIPRFLRSRAFWISFVVVMCGGLATVPQHLARLAFARAAASADQATTPQWILPAIGLAAAAVYLILCRYLRFRMLLRLGLLAKPIAFLLVRAMQATSETEEMVRAVGDTLASIAFLDLAMRVAPPGREAFGVVLLAGLPTVITFAMVPFALRVQLVMPMMLIGLGLAIVGAFLVSLLPREVH